MKKIIFLAIFGITVSITAQVGNGHNPSNILSYIPSGYTVQIYEKQSSTSTIIADNTIAEGDATDLYCNFIFDTSGKTFFVVYTTNGTNPSKSNGSSVNGSFSNYADPNRTWTVRIPALANVQGTEIRYVFYISNSDLASAWGRVAGNGYQTTWNEGDSYFSYTVEAPLPVQLTTFISSTKNNNIQLAWKTATEVNNYGFEIERASVIPSGVEGWEKIGFIQGNGNSNSPKHYTFKDSPIGGTKFHYRLKQIDFDGKFEYSPIIEVELELPSSFSVQQNYPNPFNPTTTIKYELPENSFVAIKVYDSLGRELKSLVNQNQDKGVQQITFDAGELPSGIYYYTLKAGNYSASKKMLLIK